MKNLRGAKCCANCKRCYVYETKYGPVYYCCESIEAAKTSHPELNFRLKNPDKIRAETEKWEKNREIVDADLVCDEFDPTCD